MEHLPHKRRLFQMIVILAALAPALSLLRGDASSPSIRDDEAASPTPPEQRTVMSPTGITIAFTLDRAIYSYNLQPPLPPVIPGPVVRAEITLSNQSDGDLELTFRSSQRFDFLLEDEAGKIVFQWSADKAFLTVLGTERVKAGTSLRYTKEFPLPDSTAGILPEGTYTMRGVITSEKRWISASLPLRIVHLQ